MSIWHGIFPRVTLLKSAFDESKIERDDDGKFADKGGGEGGKPDLLEMLLRGEANLPPSEPGPTPGGVSPAQMTEIDSAVKRMVTSRDDWDQRQYKPNKKTVFRGDPDSFNSPMLTAGRANENRRSRMIQTYEDRAANLVRWKMFFGQGGKLPPKWDVELFSYESPPGYEKVKVDLSADV